MDVYKSLNISMGAVTKNSEILKVSVRMKLKNYPIY